MTVSTDAKKLPIDDPQAYAAAVQSVIDSYKRIVASDHPLADQLAYKLAQGVGIAHRQKKLLAAASAKVL